MDELTQLSFRLALVASAAAALSYWLAAVSPAPARAPADGGGGVAWRMVAQRTRDVGRLWALAAAAFLVLTVAARWQAVGRAPWSNMWEFTVAFAAAVAVAYVLFEHYLKGTQVLGTIVQPLVVALLLLAVLFFPSRIEPLVPALQSQGILAAHVGFMIVSYGVLTVSFGAAVLRLAQGSDVRFARLPKAQVLENVAHGSVVVGFPLLTLGIALGAYWANSAWGRYWGWDPKETASLVTWLVYGAYLHMHSQRSWRGTRATVVLLVGYAAILFTYFGVNLWISGLHSYA